MRIDGVAARSQTGFYQKNLGPNTAALAAAMTRYDPDPGWQKVKP
jgi:Protein of unknown function (DUF2950)